MTTGNAPTTSQWSTILLPTKVLLQHDHFAPKILTKNMPQLTFLCEYFGEKLKRFDWISIYIYLVMGQTSCRKDGDFLSSGDTVHTVDSRDTSLDHLFGVDTWPGVDGHTYRMHRRWFKKKPLPEPMLTYCHSDTHVETEEIWMELKLYLWKKKRINVFYKIVTILIRSVQVSKTVHFPQAFSKTSYSRQLW